MTHPDACAPQSGPIPNWSAAVTLPVQKTDYTCGVAAVEAMFAVLSKPCPLATDALQHTLGAKPKTGVENHVLVDWLLANAPVRSHGEDTWCGGIAIANVYYRDELIESGHFELFLGNLDGVVYSWCPWLGEIRQRPLQDIEWRSGDNRYQRWSVNTGIRLSRTSLQWLAANHAPDHMPYPERIKQGLAERSW